MNIVAVRPHFHPQITQPYKGKEIDLAAHEHSIYQCLMHSKTNFLKTHATLNWTLNQLPTQTVSFDQQSSWAACPGTNTVGRVNSNKSFNWVFADWLKWYLDRCENFSCAVSCSHGSISSSTSPKRTLDGRTRTVAVHCSAIGSMLDKPKTVDTPPTAVTVLSQWPKPDILTLAGSEVPTKFSNDSLTSNATFAAQHKIMLLVQMWKFLLRNCQFQRFRETSRAFWSVSVCSSSVNWLSSLNNRNFWKCAVNYQ